MLVSRVHLTNSQIKGSSKMSPYGSDGMAVHGYFFHASSSSISPGNVAHTKNRDRSGSMRGVAMRGYMF